jgi:hypothetical protein
MRVPSRLSKIIGLIVAIALALGFVLLRSEVLSSVPAEARGSTLYDPDPKHLWNRLHEALHVRLTTERANEEFLLEPENANDDNDLDPMLWRTSWHYSKYLLTGPAGASYDALLRKAPHLAEYPRKTRDAHREALAVLDEFLDKNGEKLIRDPLRRALLQRDLWALFDSFADPIWSHWWPDRKDPSPPLYSRERRALLVRLAKILPRLALTRKQIRQLPDNYAEALKASTTPTAFDPERKGAFFLPGDLWKDDGPWVALSETGEQPLARDHIRFFGGRSAFLVFLRLPGGRQQTLDYVKRLSKHVESTEKNAVSPQFPPRTQVALVRRTLLLDDHGNIVPTHLTETVQARVYLDPKQYVLKENAADVQTFIEYRLRRRDLLAGKAGGLSPASERERERPEILFFGMNAGSHREPILTSCRTCHSFPGIESINSYTGRSFFGSHAKADLSASSVAEETRVMVNWKKRQSTWGLLEGLWTKPSP